MAEDGTIAAGTGGDGVTCDRAMVALADLTEGGLIGFYGALLGARPLRHQPGSYGELVLPGGLVLAIFVPKPAARSAFEGATAGAMSLCLQVPDLEGTIARFEAAGGTVGELKTASHGREAYGADSAGNRVILYEPRRQ